MKQIRKIYLRRIEQQHALRFFENVYEWIQLIEDKKIQPVLQIYRNAVTAYGEVMKPTPKSLLATQIAIENECRDTLCKRTYEKTKELLDHPDSHNRKIGKKINDIFTAYEKLLDLPAGEKTHLLDKFITELTEKFSIEDLSSTDFIDIVTELNRSNWSFSELIKAHKNEMDGKFITRKRMEVRKQMETVYMESIDFINAMIVYNGDEEYSEVIDQINLIVEKAMEGDEQGKNFSLPDAVDKQSHLHPKATG
ncbi:MAG: DUF6261 family protein [Tannerellaceae bacterium]|jgi:hypothetical protein|nr:DUF6261 family protein [Tannerellaceae bacterium]